MYTFVQVAFEVAKDPAAEPPQFPEVPCRTVHLVLWVQSYVGSELIKQSAAFSHSPSGRTSTTISCGQSPTNSRPNSSATRPLALCASFFLLCAAERDMAQKAATERSERGRQPYTRQASFSSTLQNSQTKKRTHQNHDLVCTPCRRLAVHNYSRVGFQDYKAIASHGHCDESGVHCRLQFKVGPKPVKSFRMIERHYFKVPGQRLSSPHTSFAG